MYTDLQNKLYLVTGASSGIGRQTTKQLLTSGARVISVARNEAKLLELQSETPAELKASLILAPRDLSLELDSIPQWIGELVTQYGKLSGMVLCAGMNKIIPLQSINQTKIEEIFNTNLISNILLIKGLAKKNNREEGGSAVVAVSSIMSQMAEQGTSLYTASKSALDATFRSLSLELAKDKIRLNTIRSGHLDNEFLAGNKNLPKEYLDNLTAKYPLGLGSNQNISDLILFLLSESSVWFTGSNITLDGGVSNKF